MWPTTSVHGVNAVNFPQMTPEHWNAALSAAVENYKTVAQEVADNTAQATFDNTLRPLEESSIALSDTFGALMCAKSHATDEIQALVTHWSPILTDVFSEIMQNQAIYDRLRAAFEREGHQWTPEQTKLHEDTLWELKEAGCGRSDADKDTIRALKTDLSRLETEFEQINLKNANNTIALPAKHLADAPEGFLDQCAHHVIDGVDHLCVPVNAAYAEPLLEHLSHRPTRQRVWEAWTGRGTGALPHDIDTAPLMGEILRKRSELAIVLGYSCWADYMLARRMEKSPSNIAQMLQQMWDKINAAAHDNIAELQQWAAGQGFDQPLQPWDLPYYARQKEQSEAVQSQGIEIKNYLPLERVRQAAFDAATRVFGVRFERDDSIPVYHPDVVAYKVVDDSGTVGVLLVDDFARPTKEPGAWMNEFASGHRLNGGNNAGVINVLNIPVPALGQPALLSHDEMVTVFHELGHALHGLLAKTTYPSHAGTRVSRDFVELPSQLLENWGTDPSAFLAMARHWQTNEPISSSAYTELLKGTFLAARFQKISYLQSAFVDLLFHTQPYDGQDIRQWEKEIVSSLNGPAALPQRHFASHFSHVFGGGYAAGYYSYLWAEILEADIAASFEGNFLSPDPDVCRRVKRLYQSGGSVNAMELFVQAKGREPTPTALLERLGISTPQKSFTP